MFRIILLLGAFAITVAGSCWGEGVKGSGRSTFEFRKPGPFSKIDMAGKGQLIFGDIDSSEIKVVVDDNLLPYITSEVKGGTLFIRETADIMPSDGIVVYVGFKQLSAITISGIVETMNEGLLKSDEFSIKVMGGGKVDLNSLFAETIHVDISGSAAVTLKGEVKDQKVDISGAGNYNGLGLLADKTEIHVSGSGYAQVVAKKLLDVVITDAGLVRYQGDPVITKEVSQGGKLEKMQSY